MNPFDLASLVGFLRIVVGIGIVSGIGWFFWGRRRNLAAANAKQPGNDDGRTTSQGGQQ
jgi:hypothetical protein